MFIIKFIRWLRGYVHFSLLGGFVERFFNLAARNRIPIWNIRWKGEQCTACTSPKGYKKLRKHARTAKVRMRIEEKKGLSIRCHRYRKRLGLVIGITIFFVFLFAMSNFIWKIEVHGNEKTETSVIMENLADLGVKPGVLRKNLDPKKVEREMMLRVDTLSWIAVNIRGSYIEISVNERVAPPERIDINTPCNVVADADGQILQMKVYDGQAALKKGDTVRKGQLLVSGIMTGKEGETLLIKHARAEVIAQTVEEVEFFQPYEITELVEDGDAFDRNTFSILGFSLPLGIHSRIQEKYHVESSFSQWGIFGFDLPMGVTTERYQLLREEKRTLTPDQAKELAIQEIEGKAKALFADGEILDRTLVGVQQDDGFLVKGTYICTRNIAKQQEILIND